MIRIRLEGTPEECNRAVTHLEADDRLNILSVSGFYPNTRGRRSSCGRIYIDAELTAETNSLTSEQM